jgi:tagatose 1,6-diphosphate aldolase
MNSSADAATLATARASALPAGTLRALTTLADDDGRFGMIAVDQRPPIFAALARHGSRQPDDVGYDEVALVKGVLVEELAPEATAVLLDPVWTHPHHLTAVPGRVGLLSTLEDHDFTVDAGERRSHPIPDWSVEKIKRSGAQGVKLLVWDRPDVGPATRAHQDAFVAGVGASCRANELPFVLELLVYPLPGEEAGSAAYARAKPERVIASVRHYAQERFGVDLFKLEFPADLKRTREFASGAFDGEARESVYDVSEVREHLRALDAAANVPWVVLSAGVGPREFAANVELACDAGASGFLAGRAVWWDALAAYPDVGAMRARLRGVSVPYLRALRATVLRGTPWTEHRRFGGSVGVEGASPTWYRDYR